MSPPSGVTHKWCNPTHVRGGAVRLSRAVCIPRPCFYFYFMTRSPRVSQAGLELTMGFCFSLLSGWDHNVPSPRHCLLRKQVELQSNVPVKAQGIRRSAQEGLETERCEDWTVDTRGIDVVHGPCQDQGSDTFYRIRRRRTTLPLQSVPQEEPQKCPRGSGWCSVPTKLSFSS